MVQKPGDLVAIGRGRWYCVSHQKPFLACALNVHSLPYKAWDLCGTTTTLAWSHLRHRDINVTFREEEPLYQR